MEIYHRPADDERADVRSYKSLVYGNISFFFYVL